jgi:hypothetical protein
MQLTARAGRWVLFAGFLIVAAPASGGSFFLTGHDPDFHALVGQGNAAGARNVNKVAIAFILDPAFNAIAASGITKFLFVESAMPPPAGHVNGVNGIVASGFKLGIDFDHHSAETLNDALDGLGTVYGGIVIASDFGGVLTQKELDILNARKTDIADFLNAGGGLYALVEGNHGAGLTPGGGHFAFLPFTISGRGLDEYEASYALTTFGSSLGLTDDDVNGNYSHYFFLGDFGLDVVDMDASGRIITLAGRREDR